MKFHLALSAMVIISIALVWALLRDTKDDLRAAKAQVQREAVANVKAKSFQPAEKVKTALNPNLERMVAAVPGPNETGDIAKPQELKRSDQVFRTDTHAMWCRQGHAQTQENPARCLYADACYGCDQSNLIRPDFDEATPLCDDGSEARLYHIVCCPQGVQNGELICPPPEACLRDESFAQGGHCSCLGQDKCKILYLEGRYECACIQ